LRRLLVSTFFFLEYKRNCLDLSLRIMPEVDARCASLVARLQTRSVWVVPVVKSGFNPKGNKPIGPRITAAQVRYPQLRRLGYENGH